MHATVYLAGPEVFHPEADRIFADKKSICLEAGLRGIAPLDNEIPLEDGVDPRRIGKRIYDANEQTMRKCNLAIANITPFRGVSADAGTVLEIGFLHGLGKTVIGYTNDARPFCQRVIQSSYGGASIETDADGMSVEAFELTDNLMIPGAIVASGGQIFVPDTHDEATDMADLTQFRRAVAFAAQLAGRSESAVMAVAPL